MRTTHRRDEQNILLVVVIVVGLIDSIHSFALYKNVPLTKDGVRAPVKKTPFSRQNAFQPPPFIDCFILHSPLFEVKTNNGRPKI
jgi:hypothetical protein